MAPANQLLPKVLWDVAEALVAGRRLSLLEEQSLSRLSPILYSFLRAQLSAAALDASSVPFLKALVAVR